MRRCQQCLSDHPFWRCNAGDREGELGRWTPDLGPDVDIFYLTYREEGWTEEQYNKELEENRRMGKKKGEGNSQM